MSKENKTIKQHHWLQHNKPNNIFRRDIDFYSESIEDAHEKAIPFLTEKKHRRNEANEATYRVLNHWEALGIIDQRPEGKGWRKYAFLDFVWLDIIQHLRSFGYPNEKIKVAYQWLTEGGKISVAQQFFFIRYAVLAMGNKPVYVLVFKDGNIDFATFQEIRNSEMLGMLDNHISIHLNPLIFKYHPNPVKKKLRPPIECYSETNTEESQILNNIRSGNFESITIKMKDGKVTFIESEEHVNSSTRIIDILKQGNFQDIELKQRDGKVISLKRTLKHKVI